MAKKIVFVYEKPMKLNDEGGIIKEASRLLGLHGSAIKPTSKFTIGMRSAVIAFQKKNKLKPTGTIDKKTWEKLNK